MNQTTKYICSIILGIGLIIVFLFFRSIDFGDTRWNDDSIYFRKGVVKEVIEEKVEMKYPNLYVGSQQLIVDTIDINKNQMTVPIENYLSVTHSIYVKEGDNIIVRADEPKGVDPLYFVYAYNRTGKIILLIALFFLLLILLGKKKGVKSIGALLVSMYLLLGLMVPLIYLGYSPIVVSISVCILATVYSNIILFGYSKMTAVNLMSIGISFLLCALLYLFTSTVLHISGYHYDQAEDLLIITQMTGLQLRHLLFVAVIISTLGASKDVSVSIASSLWEIKRIHPNSTRKGLFESGLNIGKDIISTMVDTLLFAFLGTAIVTVMIWISYGIQFEQLVNSNYFAIQVILGLVSTSVVVMVVPVTSFIGSWLYNIND